MAKGPNIIQTHQGLQITDTELIFTQFQGGLRQERMVLEEGVIVNGVLKNREAFGVSLKALMDKLALKRKDICLMIPEYIAFVQLLDITSNTATEQVQEAIEWGIKSHLPRQVEEMHIDWRLLSKSEAGSTYQVVAVAREYLQAYLSVVKEVTSVKVVAVETPSLALQRLVPDDETVCVVAGLDQMATMIVVGPNKGIHVTSIDVLDESSGDELKKVMKQMIGYAKKKHSLEVTKVLYVGSQYKLLGDLGLKEVTVEVAKGDWGQPGLALGYLLAEKPVTPPADPETINLMPVEFHGDYAEVARVSYGAYAMKLSLICLLVLNVVTMPLVVMGFLNKQAAINRLEELVGQTGSLNEAGKLAKLETQVGLINQVGPRRIETALVLKKLAAAIPEGVSVDSIDLDLFNSAITLNAKAATADDILKFKDKVEEIDSLGELQIPLNVFEKQQDIVFSVTLKWYPDILLATENDG